MSKEFIHSLKIELCRRYGLQSVPRDSDILRELESTDILSSYPDNFIEALRRALVKKPSRTLSGVAPVAIMTSPFDCPHGRCSYCPGGTQSNTPQSYTGHEPAAMRAAQHGYDPYRQVQARLRQYEDTGHSSEKVDLIVMGGTFPARPPEYQAWFVRRALDAMNGSDSSSLYEAKMLNEGAPHRCIGLTVETRPDYSFEEHINMMLALGTTRVELGVQSLDDDILNRIHRGHGVAESIRATRLLKDSGLKVVYHMMPNLPGSTPESDLEMLMDLFRREEFRPDMLKIYPTLVIPGTELYRWWKKGDYTPYPLEDLIDLLADFKASLPPYVRIQRIQRDIPAQFIEDGVVYSNLREMVQMRLAETGRRCGCIRCHEVGRTDGAGETEMRHMEYKASGGTEKFLYFADDNDAIYAYLRLRFPSEPFRPELRGAAVVRELKVVGRALPIGDRSSEAVQHTGLGSKLLSRAEELAAAQGYERMAITSGVGVRGYYRKRGYTLYGAYMVKDLD